MERAMIGKRAVAVSAAGLAALMTYPLVLRAQTPAPIVDSTAAKLPPQPEADVATRKGAKSAADEQDTMILARQGLMEGIYQYMEDADDWTDQSPGAGDAAMLGSTYRRWIRSSLRYDCAERSRVSCRTDRYRRARLRSVERTLCGA